MAYFIKSVVCNLWRKHLAPRSVDIDEARQEFILNILLIAIIAILFVGLSIHVIFWNVLRALNIENYNNNTLPLGVLLGVCSFFVGLYVLSRKGFFRLASYLFLAPFFLLAAYMGYRWGFDVPASALFYILVIVIAGVLLNTRLAFFATGIIALVLITTGFLQISNTIEVSQFWKHQAALYTDIIMTTIVFLVIATVSWLSNREIEKSLVRARKSEADLRDERDSLEVKVKERTKELKEVQAEKMTQLYRFAEFGRISSGLFHDLINPLNAVSLNMEKLKSQHTWILRDSGKPNISLDETSGYLERAVSAARRLENMVVAVRKQLARKETKVLFSIEEEICHVIDVLSHKAQKENIELHFMPGDDIKTLKIFGDAVKFNQVVLNLIANGIDACMSVKTIAINRLVQVSLVEESGIIIIGVEDNGVGISKHHIDKIFEPFFTTKITGQGIGIGLSIAKRIVEKDFGGLLVAKSKVGKGSFFKVSLPIRKQVIEYA